MFKNVLSLFVNRKKSQYVINMFPADQCYYRQIIFSNVWFPINLMALPLRLMLSIKQNLEPIHELGLMSKF